MLWELNITALVKVVVFYKMGSQHRKPERLKQSKNIKIVHSQCIVGFGGISVGPSLKSSCT